MLHLQNRHDFFSEYHVSSSHLDPSCFTKVSDQMVPLSEIRNHQFQEYTTRPLKCYKIQYHEIVIAFPMYVQVPAIIVCSENLGKHPSLRPELATCSPWAGYWKTQGWGTPRVTASSAYIHNKIRLRGTCPSKKAMFFAEHSCSDKRPENRLKVICATDLISSAIRAHGTLSSVGPHSVPLTNFKPWANTVRTPTWHLQWKDSLYSTCYTLASAQCCVAAITQR